MAETNYVNVSVVHQQKLWEYDQKHEEFCLFVF